MAGGEIRRVEQVRVEEEAVRFEDAYARTCKEAPNVKSFSEAESRRYWGLLEKLPAAATVVEIGLQYGRSSSLVAQAAASNGFLHVGIDPFIDPPGARERWLELMLSFGHRWVHHDLRSDDPALLPLLPAQIDLGLIDGGHWPVDVENDIKVLSPRVVSGGHLLFHDYGVGLPNVYPPVDPEFVRARMPSSLWVEEDRADTLGVWRRR